MDAPITAYFTDENGNPSEVSGCLVARPLKASREDGGYSETAEFMQFYIRQIFALDGLLLVRNNSNGLIGFIGMVRSGGANAAMHNLDKRNSGKTLRDSRGSLVLLNDAGLNTLPLRCQIEGIGEGGELVFENYCRIRFYLKNAFYGKATWKLKLRRESTTSTLWQTKATGTVSPDGEAHLEYDDGLPAVIMGGSSSLYIRLELSNAEGTITAEQGPVEVLPRLTKVTVYECLDRSRPWNWGTPMEVYMGENDYAYVHRVVSGTQSQLIPESSLPDGGKMYRLTAGGFAEMPSGDYNIWNVSGVVYSSGNRMMYIYRPNTETASPQWYIIVGCEIQKAATSAGWPEAASEGYMYRIALTAKYVAVAGITSVPPMSIISDINITAVNDDGLPVLSLLVDRSSWDEDTTLTLSSANRAVSSDTYIYAKDAPNMQKAYGIKVASFTVSPSSMGSEGSTTPLP